MLSEIQISIIELMKSNESIPPQLIEYTKLAFERYNKENFKSENRYVEVLTELPEAVIRDIGKMFKMAINATGLSPKELAIQSGFNKKDLDPSRVESWLAEIRLLNYLSELGFSKIRFLKAGKTKKADLYAEKEGLKYVVEITALGYYSDKRKWTVEEIILAIEKKLDREGKFEQLIKTVEEEACDRMILGVIVDAQGMKALNSSEDFKKAAKEVFSKYKKDNFHICIAMGQETLGYGRDDIFYPPWPRNLMSTHIL